MTHGLIHLDGGFAMDALGWIIENDVALKVFGGIGARVDIVDEFIKRDGVGFVHSHKPKGHLGGLVFIPGFDQLSLFVGNTRKPSGHQPGSQRLTGLIIRKFHKGAG